ncbi:MAG: ABC transporter ATP-binding protein [Firmicutes bacterium]|nr:ABC transporter ATP-binding protein [Bacillota bacterium]
MISLINKLFKILTAREKFQLAALLLAMIITAFTQTLGIASVFPFITLIMQPNLIFENRWLYWTYQTFNFSSAVSFIIFAGITMFIIIVVSNMISAFTTWLNFRFVWMNNHRLSRRLLEKYLSMPYPYFLNKNSSELSKNVLADVSQLTGSFMIPLMNIASRGLAAIFIFTMLLWINALASILTILIIGGAYALIYWRVNKNLKQRGEQSLAANLYRFKVVLEAFGGIKDIKVLNREDYFLDQYTHHSYRFARHNSWNAVISQLPRFALEAIAFGGVIIFVLVLLIQRGEATQVIPLASVFAFAGYRLMFAMQEIFSCFTQMQFSRALFDRIYADFTTPDQEGALTVAQILKDPNGIVFNHEIVLNNISFTYQNTEQPVVSEINLVIKKNSSVALVGATGAGKTTLVDIMIGLMLPQQGTMLIDQLPLTSENVRSWQRKIGYVSQHIYLTDDTVTRNIAFGIPDQSIDHEKVVQSARLANIDKFIENDLPAGYKTIIGEHGVRLSGGQRQRLGVARAFYHDPEVLVFDEATSALDGVTEDAVLASILSTASSKTLIIIAHRLTTIKNCDWVYMMDQGRIIASGTYDTLLADNKMFRAMAKVGKLK